jgi:hypothetical protein
MLVLMDVLPNNLGLTNWALVKELKRERKKKYALKK